MKAKEFSPEYQEALKRLPLPELKSHKIIYFLWLDDQVMELWSEYLNMKCYSGDDPEEYERIQSKIEDKLLLIDHFEMYLDALRLHLTYTEIDKWTIKNNYYKKHIYNRF